MRSPYTSRSRAALVVLAWATSLTWLACGGEDISAPATGQIEISITTSGPEPDPDGYTLSIDGAPADGVEPNTTRTVTVPAGDHTVELGGLAANCAVQGDAQRSIQVTGGGTSTVQFEVVCPASSGALRVVTVTTGAQVDADGYQVVVDEAEPLAIETNGDLAVNALPVGDHVVRLAGIADNCTLAGDNPRTATVPGGDVVEVTFELSCVATLGAVAVTTTTTGPSPDPDGYELLVDEQSQPIGSAATVTVEGLTPGPHSVQLAGLSANCRVEGDNPRQVEIVVGQTAELTFAVTCAAGSITWTPQPNVTDADLTEVWGTSGTNVFTVGERATDTDLFSVIFRYDGTRWDRQLAEDGLRLRGVWGSGPADVYAVGFDFFSPDARVLRYDGTRWSPVEGFASDGFEELRLLSVWGSSPTDVFIVGAAFDGEFDRSLIFHYDGVSWTRMFVGGDVDPGLADVWGSGPSDVYAVGQDDFAEPSNGLVLHFDGQGWSPVLQVENLLLNSVWGSSATDVFAVGFQVEEVGEEFEVSGAIWHYDGTSWTRMAIPTTQILQEVWGTSATDVYAVGQDGIILHYDGTGWSATTPTSNTLLGVWSASPSEAFAVGNRGTILRGAP
jgi:hypothetical protein